MKQKITLLFLCTGNSCRSQMAEGWASHLKSDVIESYSAGIENHGLNENAVKVMQEAGVDISSNSSKTVDELSHLNFDFIITVCGHAHETCPVFIGGGKVVHKGFPDPPALAREILERGGTEEEVLDCYRKVRDRIRGYVDTLPEALYS